MFQIKTIITAIALFSMLGCAPSFEDSASMKAKKDSLGGGGSTNLVASTFAPHDPEQTQALLRSRIERTFNALLGRSPSDFEASRWGYLENDLFMARLLVHLGSSDEFRYRFPNRYAYIGGLYAAFFGDANFDLESRARFTEQLNQGGDRSDVVEALLFSAPFFQSMADEAYLRLLERRAEQGTGAEWLSEHRRGIPIRDQWSKIMASDEFARGLEPVQIIDKMFRKVLARSASLREIDSALLDFDLATEEGRSALSVQLLSSPEFLGIESSSSKAE